MTTTIIINPLYLLAAGLLVNLIMLGIKREHWSTAAAKSATIGLSFVAAFIAVLADQQHLNATLVGGAFVGTLGINQTAYGLLLKNTKLGALLSGVFTPNAAQASSQAAVAAQIAGTMVSTDPAPNAAPAAPVTPPAPPTA